MAPNRLQKLKQQKQLILEHLDWLNQEIDRETIAAKPSPSPKTNRLIEAIPEDKEVASQLEIESTPRHQVASDLYSELGPDTKSAASETKRGCLFIAALAFAGLAAVIGWVVFYY